MRKQELCLNWIILIRVIDQPEVQFDFFKWIQYQLSIVVQQQKNSTNKDRVELIIFFFFENWVQTGVDFSGFFSISLLT